MFSPSGPAYAYATLADLYAYGAPSKAFGTMTDGERLSFVVAASREIDGYANRQGAVPLLAVDDTVIHKCCAIAAYEALAGRAGFNPTAGSDTNYLLRVQEARAWLKMWAKGEVSPLVVYASAPGVFSQPKVISRKLRGW